MRPTREQQELKDRIEIINNWDVKKFKQVSGARTDEVAIIAMHKVRASNTFFHITKRIESAQWLEDNGYAHELSGG